MEGLRFLKMYCFKEVNVLSKRLKPKTTFYCWKTTLGRNKGGGEIKNATSFRLYFEIEKWIKTTILIYTIIL